VPSNICQPLGHGGQDSLGGETLLQLLKNYARNRNMKTAITVGIVGGAHA
jgi:hypothetical protein